MINKLKILKEKNSEHIFEIKIQTKYLRNKNIREKIKSRKKKCCEIYFEEIRI